MKFWRSSQPTATPQVPERRSFIKRLLAFTAGGAALAAVKPREASAGAEPFLGEIELVGFNFAPQGWATCDGQLLAINQFTALFSLLGTTYGGDGLSTFALPDLRGRAPIHMGQGPGLSPNVIGQTGGAESITLLATQMPAHAHVMSASSSNGTTSTPTGGVPAKNASGVPSFAALPGNAAMGAMSTVGGNQPHENRPPYLTMNYIIALQGIFPSRS